MKIQIFISIIAFVSIAFEINAQDTVYIKQPFDLENGKRIYKTDTIIFPGSLHKHILVGTTILTSTLNQQDAKNYGLYFNKVDFSECNGDATIEFVPNKINSVINNDSLLLIDFNITSNCCYSFLCDIQILNETTLNLIYYGYGNYCDCECCFGLKYFISKESVPDFGKIKSIIINNNFKTSFKLK